MSAETVAAGILRQILGRLEPSGTDLDKRSRRAITAAIRALEHGRDPHRAIERVYAAR